MADGVERGDLSVRIDGQKAETAEVDVHQEGIADIGLAVVAEDDEIRLVQRALAAQAFQNSAELLIVHAQLRLGLLTFHAVGVPGGVEVAQLDEHDVRLRAVLQDVERQRHGEQVKAAGRPHQVAAVFIEVTVHQVCSGRVLQPFLRLVALIAVWNDHRHIHGIVRAAGNGPAQRAGRQAVLAGDVQQRFAADIGLHAVPRRVKMAAAGHFFIVDDPVPPGVGAGQDRGMAGVGQGREHRLDLFDERAALQKLREVRHAAHARDVGGTEGIDTEYKDFRHRFSFLLERRRVRARPECAGLRTGGRPPGRPPVGMGGYYFARASRQAASKAA